MFSLLLKNLNFLLSLPSFNIYSQYESEVYGGLNHMIIRLEYYYTQANRGRKIVCLRVNVCFMAFRDYRLLSIKNLVSILY